MRPRLALALALALGCGGGAQVDDPADGGPVDTAQCGDGVVDEAAGEVCDDGVNDAFGGGCQPGCARVDDSDAAFDHLLTIDLELAPGAWDALRRERQTVHQVFGAPGCSSSPVESPYSWYDVVARVDGVGYPAAGLRKKGFIGSQSTVRPSLKLRFGDGADLGTLRSLTLNNSRSDRSLARTCLAYGVFRAAGIAAPRCGHALVSVDGAPLGVYVTVEEVDEDFVSRRFADPRGGLYEGTANDFRADFIGGLKPESALADDDSEATLQQVTDVLAGAGDADLVAGLEPLIDLDGFFRFWAAESLIWHRDGYAGNINNYFVYADPAIGGRLRFLPWGPDTALRRNVTEGAPDSVLAFGALTARLYAIDEGRARYHAALDALLEGWRADDLIAEVDRITARVAPSLDERERSEQAAEAAELNEILAERAPAIAAARAGGDPAWTLGMRGSFCRTPLGPIAVSFSTTWGTLAQSVFAAGSGTFAVSFGGAPIAVERVGARAGTTTSGLGRIQVSVDFETDRRLNLTADLPDPHWFDPFLVLGEQALIRPPVNLSMTQLDLAVSPAATIGRYEIGEGTWTFEAIGDGAGDAVVGHFEATLFELP